MDVVQNSIAYTQCLANTYNGALQVIEIVLMMLLQEGQVDEIIDTVIKRCIKALRKR